MKLERKDFVSLGNMNSTFLELQGEELMASYGAQRDRRIIAPSEVVSTFTKRLDLNYQRVQTESIVL
jgi:hypothetical protein